MNPLNRNFFYKGFRKQLYTVMAAEKAETIWSKAGEEYRSILHDRPELKKHKGAMVLPAAALFRVLNLYAPDSVNLLNEYGEYMGKRFAHFVHNITAIPGVSRFIWNHVENLTEKMSSESKGYKRRLVSDPPHMYGVDILSCPYHELAKELGTEQAVLCICHMDKEYTKGFRKIRYIRNSALPEGADCCEYRLYSNERRSK